MRFLSCSIWQETQIHVHCSTPRGLAHRRWALVRHAPHRAYDEADQAFPGACGQKLVQEDQRLGIEGQGVAPARPGAVYGPGDGRGYDLGAVSTGVAQPLRHGIGQRFVGAALRACHQLLRCDSGPLALDRAGLHHHNLDSERARLDAQRIRQHLYACLLASYHLPIGDQIRPLIELMFTIFPERAPALQARPVG